MVVSVLAGVATDFGLSWLYVQRLRPKWSRRAHELADLGVEVECELGSYRSITDEAKDYMSEATRLRRESETKAWIFFGFWNLAATFIVTTAGMVRVDSEVNLGIMTLGLVYGLGAIVNGLGIFAGEALPWMQELVGLRGWFVRRK